MGGGGKIPCRHTTRILRAFRAMLWKVAFTLRIIPQLSAVFQVGAQNFQPCAAAFSTSRLPRARALAMSAAKCASRWARFSSSLNRRCRRRCRFWASTTKRTSASIQFRRFPHAATARPEHCETPSARTSAPQCARGARRRLTSRARAVRPLHHFLSGLSRRTPRRAQEARRTTQPCELTPEWTF